MTCRCKGCWRSTDSSIIYELCRKDINAAISMWGCLLGLSNPAYKRCHLFIDGNAELFIPQLPVQRRLLRLPGELVWTGLGTFLVCISNFALFYEGFKGVSKQPSDSLGAGYKKWKSHVLHSPGKHKSFSTQTPP